MDFDGIKIEKGVAAPASRGVTNRGLSAFLRTLRAGDSFFFEGERADANRVRAAGSYESRDSTKRFLVRKVSGGYRCWRTA